MYNPFYWEDIDLSYRAIKHGYSIHFDKNIRTIHEHDAGAIRKNNTTSKIEFYAYRNQFLFFWLNITDSSLWIKHLLWLPIHFINALRDRNSVFFRAFFRALLLFPVIVSMHRKNNKDISLHDA